MFCEQEQYSNNTGKKSLYKLNIILIVFNGFFKTNTVMLLCHSCGVISHALFTLFPGPLYFPY